MKSSQPKIDKIRAIKSIRYLMSVLGKLGLPSCTHEMCTSYWDTTTNQRKTKTERHYGIGLFDAKNATERIIERASRD